MSRIAAPVGEVMTPMRFGRAGKDRLRSGSEQAFGGQPGAQFLELPLQRTEARILHVIDDELVFAARLIESNPRAHQHLLAVAGGEGTQHISLPEHRAAHLRGGVL